MVLSIHLFPLLWRQTQYTDVDYITTFDENLVIFLCRLDLSHFSSRRGEGAWLRDWAGKKESMDMRMQGKTLLKISNIRETFTTCYTSM